MRKNKMGCFKKRVAAMIWGAKSQEGGEIRAHYLPLERTPVYLSKKMLSNLRKRMHRSPSLRSSVRSWHGIRRIRQHKHLYSLPLSKRLSLQRGDLLTVL